MKKIFKGIIALFNILTKKINLRKNGISGHICVRNEDKTIRLCVESIIDFVDELVIQYNDCTDNTEVILLELEKKYSNKIRLFKWEKKPFKMWDYRNFGMKKCKYKWYFKIDADQIYDVDTMYRAIILNSKNTTVYENGGICPFIFGDSYCFLKNGVKNYTTHDSVTFPLNNISESCHLFVRGAFDKYIRNDDTAYCESIKIPLFKWKPIYLADFFIHFIYVKRKFGESFKKDDFIKVDNIKFDDIFKLKLGNNIKLIELLKTSELNDIKKKFIKDDKKSPTWYQQKQEMWKDEIVK